MPRKTTIPPQPPAPSPLQAGGHAHRRAQGLVGVLVYVDPEVRDALRAGAERRGVSLQAFGREILGEAAGKVNAGKDL